MKKLFGIFIIIILLCFSTISYAEALDRKIEFDSNHYTAYIGKQIEITATVVQINPDAPSQTKLLWSSSDETIAKVSTEGTISGVSKGIITGKSVGTVTIYAKAKDNESIYNSVTIDVQIPVQT